MKHRGAETAEEYLRAVEWPEMRRVKVPRVGVRECMLVCAGFEDRSVEALRRVRDAGVRGLEVAVIEYRPVYGQNRRREIVEICQAAGFRARFFTYDREDPGGAGERLARFGSQYQRMVVDVSGMSRLLIVQTLVALMAQAPVPVTVVYGEAESYRPTEDEFAGRQRTGSGIAAGYLSSGIFEIASTPELASVSMLGEAIRLVAFPSFDPAQLKNLLEELQPTYVELVGGKPPADVNRWRTGAIDVLNSAAVGQLRGAQEHTACTRDYRETLRVLLEIYQQRSMFDRLVVAPTGSKMQAVAVGVFRGALYDVQIVYPTPRRFTDPDGYTAGVRQLYELDLPMEDLTKVVG